MFTPNSSSTISVKNPPMRSVRCHCPRSTAEASIGAISRTCVGFEKVAIPMKMAAMASDRLPRNQRTRVAADSGTALAPTTSL